MDLTRAHRFVCCRRFSSHHPVVGSDPCWRTLRTHPADFGLHAETVSFPSQDGILLKAWYIPASGRWHGTVIVAHGIDGNRSDMLPRAASWSAMAITRWLRTGIWMTVRTESTLRPIVSRNSRSFSSLAPKICPPGDARKMYKAARSDDKALLIHSRR
jgi:hypothetical protein